MSTHDSSSDACDMEEQIGSRFTRLARRLLLRTSQPAPADAPSRWQEWSIGIYAGPSPVGVGPPDGVTNPVLTRDAVSDVPAEFVADPFMLRVDGTWYMFFEVMNHRSGRGEIGLATSGNAVDWTYQQIVLAEPFHLSYPYVFEWQREHYMIPETGETGSVRLYKAVEFPRTWSFAGTLVSGRRFVDASVARHAEKWWLFAETNGQMQFDTLRLYYADELAGPWTEHPRSPIVGGDASMARPAGRVLVGREGLIRFAQNCRPAYGSAVRAHEIHDLTTSSYGEREVTGSPILRGTGSGWNRDGMHHIDPHLLDDGSWIACVDGWTWR